jgi:uncharacterized membrane protein
MNMDDEQQKLGLERIVFFSDAVMAIAITLLVIDLRVPEVDANLAASQLPDRLLALLPNFTSFLISFLVIGVYWNSHHRYFLLIKRFDRKLIILNLFFLLFIALMPFVSGLLGRYSNLPLGVVPYSLDVSLIGLTMAGIWAYATHGRRLVEKSLEDKFIHKQMVIMLISPAVFLLSMIIGIFSPFLALIVWWTAPLAAFIVIRLFNHRRLCKE